jgi:ATP-dependent Clp protease ATP-binding subunit ClpX
MNSKDKVKCTLCGKTSEQVSGKIISGLEGSVCKECNSLCTPLFAQMEEAPNFAGMRVPPAPEIKAFLDQYVIGQERAKRVISVAVHNHYSRITSTKDAPMPEVELDKSNVLLIGPTGSGKTLLAQTVARMLDVPCAISDATTLTEAGYVGEDVENVILRLYQAANGNLEATERGIIVIDEIDKKAKKNAGVSLTRDVGGDGVQYALLKIVEGMEADVPLAGGRKHPNGENVRINTKNILFIFCGAFVGLDKIVKSRIKGKSSLGFDSCDVAGHGLENIEPEDLIAFGLVPELVGRIPVVSNLEKLSESDLVHILTQPKNAILKQYEKLAMLDKATINFTHEAKLEIAHQAFTKGTGARGLRSVVEMVLLDIMYDIHEGSVIEVTKEMVVNKSIEDQKALQIEADEKVA